MDCNSHSADLAVRRVAATLAAALCLACLGPAGAQDEQPADSSAVPAAPAAPARFELQLDLNDLAEAGDYAAAAALAAPLLELAAAEFGDSSIEYAETLLLVSETLSGNGEYDRAEEHVLTAIEIYRQQEGQFDEALVRPYIALGDNYQAARDYRNAFPAYEEARSISRRVNGLLNEDQVEILGRMSETAEAMGDIAEARDYQDDALSIVRRRHEPHSPEVIAAVIRYGAWLRDHNLFTAERALYMESERDVVRELGDESVLLVPLLRERANSFRSEALNHPAGSGALDMALQILGPDPDPLLYAEVQRDRGDWETAFDQYGTDGVEYISAWTSLGEVENGEALRAEWFDQHAPRAVLLAARSRRFFSYDPDDPMGTLTIRFTVLPSGVPAEIEISDSDPPGLVDDAFRRQIRASRFRPTIQDGRLVSTRTGYRVEFGYDPRRLDR